MDWLQPIIDGASTFSSGMAGILPGTFEALFISDALTGTPTELAIFILQMAGMALGITLFVLAFSLLARYIRKRVSQRKLKRA